MKPLKFLFGFFLLIGLCSGEIFGQRTKDGKKTLSNPNSIVNEFSFLASDVSSGDKILILADPLLNTNGRFPAPLQNGDLLMIIQMQGASINGTSNDSTWGEIISYNNCGLYEFLEVSGVSGNQVSLACEVQNNYSSAGRTQVIRVPRFASLTVEPGAVLTTEAWNGLTGGVLVAEVAGRTIIKAGGFIDVTGLGFRPGGNSNSSSIPGTGIYFSQNAMLGGEKGESIAGFQVEYDALGGRYGRGAPANGGGGGNAHNSGGGGGSNAGIIANYNGNGNPSLTGLNWQAAWELEFTGFANSTSSGGGKGGYSFALNNGDALTSGPGNPAWGGDNRQNAGGKGGRPLDYSTGRIFLGGGGGSGDANDNNSGIPGSGGGLVYLLSYGNIIGAGTIIADGTDGLNTTGAGIDAASGGGGGGTVILNATGDISGISISANGGKGGNQVLTMAANPNESEGPGGGGGGGYIAISNGNIARTASGGKNGTTNSMGVTEFTPNGATSGGEGLAFETVIPYDFELESKGVNICTGDKANLYVFQNGSPSPNSTIYWHEKPGGDVIATGNHFETPLLEKNTTYYISTCPLNKKDSIVVIVEPCKEAEIPVGELEFTFFVPNTFTPNKDGLNETFFGTGLGILDYEMWIFNRWGEMVFYTNDINKAWDGKIETNQGFIEAQMDAYAWKVLLRNVFGETLEYYGQVTLLR